MLFSSNIRLLRNRKKRTQETVATELGISRSTLNSYESGIIVNPTVEALLKFADYYKVSVDTLLRIDLSTLSESKLREIELGYDAYVRGSKLRVLATTVDSKNRENIEAVPLKAKAGYRTGYSDPDYIGKLPVFQLPILFKERKYRMFQIQGDSMEPIPDKSWVIGEFLENWYNIKDGEAYIILTKDDGIVFKIACNQLKKKRSLLLKSLNPAYEPYEVNANDILEVWSFCNYISNEIPDAGMKENFLPAIHNLEKTLKDLKQQMQS
ncbi:MAG: helix-turn-helix domain-containing protein [Bacteroidia bacterium]|nr:helix-turn-helix domain-containing protein [Bacteroidia bacterium]